MSFILQQPQGSPYDPVFDASDLVRVMLTEFPQSSAPYYQHYFSQPPADQTIICVADWEDPYRQQFCAPHFDQQFHLGAGDPWLKPICEGSTCQLPPCVNDCGPHPTPEPQFVLMLLAFFVAIVALKCIWRTR